MNIEKLSWEEISDMKDLLSVGKNPSQYKMAQYKMAIALNEFAELREEVSNLEHHLWNAAIAAGFDVRDKEEYEP